MNLFTVVVTEDNETYQYQYGCIEHAREAYDNETCQCTIIEHDGNKDYLVATK